MKTARNIIISLIFICALCYLSVFLIVPFILNAKNYSSVITQTLKEETGLDLIIRSYKISVSPTLNITMKCGHIELFYPNNSKTGNTKILDIQGANLDFSTLSLLRKELKVQSLNAKKIQVSTKILPDGRFSIQEYLEKNKKAVKNEQFKISEEIPSIKIDNLLIKIKDEKTSQKFKFEGNNLKLNKSLIGKNLLLTTNGNIYYFDEKYFGYKLKLLLDSSMLKELKLKPIKLSFDDLQKYKFQAEIDADLKIEQPPKSKKPKIFGYINIDKFSMISNGIRLPESHFHLLIKNNKGELDSDFYASKMEKAIIKAKFDDAKNIYINCSTKKLSFKNAKPVLITILEMLRIKNNLKDFNMSGYLISDFEVATDLKKIKSHGKLKIVDSSIRHKSIPLNISKIIADIDFSDNNIKINNSKMLVNNQPVNLTGSVDEKANGNISLNAYSLELNHLMNAFPVLKPSKNITVKSGKLSFEAKLNGKLTKVSPKITALITNFSASDKKSGGDFLLNKISLNIENATQNKFNGTVICEGISVFIKGLPSSVTAQKITGTFDEKDFELKPSKLSYDKAFVTVEGNVKSYLKAPEANFSLFGTLDTRVAKSLLPEGVTLLSKGILPIGAKISANEKNINAKINILASENAYITPIILKNLKNTLFHINADFDVKEERLIISDCSLYYPPAKIQLSQNPDTSKLKTIMSIDGVINNIQNPVFSNIHVVIPSDIKLSAEPVDSVSLKTDVKINGTIKAPEIEGIVNISDLHINNRGLYIKKADIRTDKNVIYLKADSVKIEDTFINVEAIANKDFINSKKINNLNITAPYLDMENIMKLSSLLPHSQYTPGNESPFEILTGKLNIKAVKLNNIKAQNITAEMKLDKSILQLNNVRANAYGGNIAANITYNMPYLSTHATVQARGLDSAAAAIELLPEDMHLSGKLNFDSDISLSGLTQASQMKTLTGNADIMITNAQLGPLGRFEHFLHAQNLLSQRLIFASLNSAKRAIAPKNTGYVNILKGELKFKNGMVYLSPLTTSGPQMSMFVTGTTNLLTGIVDVQILGRVSPDVSDSVGILGDFTLKNFLDDHPKYGETITKLFTSYNTELPEMDISKIPQLSSKYAQETKNFRVLIDGDPNSVKAIKSFTWINPSGSQSAALKKKNTTVTSTDSNQEKQEKPAEPAHQTTTQTQIQPSVKQVTPPTQVKNSSFLDSIPDDFR